MSQSAAELLRQVKSQIEEVDPSEVAELMHEGVAIIDVRETDEYATGHLPGAKHVPRSYLETRIEGIVPDRSSQVILYCASGNRSAYGARTLEQDLGYENVRSMTGGIT
ncbi:MAG TPA: rhodanese-like domain-containing protein, partial [Solirubrobacteraceae bacterium]|nr:rhodanese-like domain-containing protein [Solirubrobacteraceae bacterium]